MAATFEVIEYRAGYRVELCQESDYGSPYRDLYRATGPADVSGHHSTLTSYGPCPNCGESAYVSACALCWLGHGHTCDYHAASLATGEIPNAEV